MLVRYLSYFVTLARERHFARAAEVCHIAQPTLSAAIRKLEEDLGTPLVERSHRFVGLTPEGEKLLVWGLLIAAIPRPAIIGTGVDAEKRWRRSGAASLAEQIFAHPGMLRLFQFADRRNRDDLPIRERRDPIGNRIERVDVVGYEKDRKTQAVREIENQTVNLVGHDGIEAGGRFIEDQKFGIERDGPRDPRRASASRLKAHWDICRSHRREVRPSSL